MPVLCCCRLAASAGAPPGTPTLGMHRSVAQATATAGAANSQGLASETPLSRLVRLNLSRNRRCELRGVAGADR